MTPLLVSLHSVVQEIFERSHDNLRMSAIAAMTALYQLAARCWPEMGYDRGDAESNPLALVEAHEILTTAWQGEIHRAIIHVAEESSQEDAAFLYFMLGFLAAGYRDHLKYGRTPKWVEDFLRAEEEEAKKLQWNAYAVEGTSPAWLSIGQRVTVAFVELADENYEIDDASHPIDIEQPYPGEI
jgi:hypothetical protein